MSMECIFDLRAIYIISATKAFERSHITIKPFFIFWAEGDTSLYRLYPKPTDLWCNRLCIHPYTWVIFLQIFSIKRTEKFFSFQCFQNICISRNTSANLIRSFPCWGPFVEFGIHGSYRQNQFPHQVSLVKSFGFDLLIIPL